MILLKIQVRLPLAALVVAGAMGSGCNKESGDASSGPGKPAVGPAATQAVATLPAAPEPPKAPELNASAAGVWKAYNDDAKAADSKYKGKYVEVSGLVANPGSPAADEPAGNYFVVSGAADPALAALGPLVRCYVTAADSARCDLLGQGQTITFRGTCDGWNSAPNGMLLDFKNCSIIQTGKDPTPTYPARELAAAYARDEGAAKSKYKYGGGSTKDVLITGTVQKLDEANHEVWLDGGNSADGKPLSVHCRVYPAVWVEAAKHAVGQPITIKSDLDDFKGDYLQVNFCIPLP